MIESDNVFQFEICIEWFFKTFGSKNIGFSLLQDFILTFNEYSNLNERCAIFKDLIDWEKREGGEAQMKQSKSAALFEKSKYRKVCYKTYFSCNCYLKIVRMIANFLKKHNDTKYLPNFPNIFLKDTDNIPMDLAKEIMKTYFLEIGYSFEKIKVIFDRIDTPQEKMDSSSVLKVKKMNSKEEIKFDKLCRYLLDKTLEGKIHDLERLHGSIKLRQHSFMNKKFTIDDYESMIRNIFQTNTDKIFISSTFNEYMKKMMDSSSVQEAVFEMVPWLLNDFKNDEQKEDFNGTFSEVLEKKPEMESTKSTGKGVLKLKIETVVGKNFDHENEFILENYDFINSLGLLQESYALMKELIMINEKHNEIVKTLHQELKELFVKLPHNVAKNDNYLEFNNFAKKELLNLIENSWNKFRELLSYN